MKKPVQRVSWDKDLVEVSPRPPPAQAATVQAQCKADASGEEKGLLNMSKPPIQLAKVREAYVLMHRRLGHPRMTDVGRLLSEKLVEGLPPSMTALPAGGCGNCETCDLCKVYRLPFPASTSHTDGPLDLLHLDIMGPLPASA